MTFAKSSLLHTVVCLSLYAIQVYTWEFHPDLLSQEEYPCIPELSSEKIQNSIQKIMQKMYKSGGDANFGDESGVPLILTKYIEDNKLMEAREAAYVHSDYLLSGVDSYAGYFTVNKEYNANLWLWYFPVMDKPVEETPWIIWLQGGPGESSLLGLFTEIGPFVVANDTKLEEMKYSWCKNHSLLFIDNPVGTGFSFTDDQRGYATNQTTIGENLYDALQQFLTIFPELRKAPLTIAGESYAGKHIPSLGVQILWHRRKDQDRPINLTSLAIGNGLLDPLTLQRYSYFVREVGLVGDKAADVMKRFENATRHFIKDKQMIKAFNSYRCMMNVFRSASNLKNWYNYLVDEESTDGAYVDFIQRPEVRRALHVGSTNFTSLGEAYVQLVPDFMNSVKMWIDQLLDHYEVLLYNGHLDIIVAYHPSVNTYKSLSFNGSEEYKQFKRQPWYHNGRLAGLYKKGGKLTEVMVRGAGHMVPADRPSEALALISAFVRGIPLDKDTGYLAH